MAAESDTRGALGLGAEFVRHEVSVYTQDNACQHLNRVLQLFL
jgi:hypothetical protein